MEARQFYNRCISPVVTKTFSCKWSEDNRLSLITEKGVHILEVVPAPMQTNPILKLSCSFIYCPEILPGKIYINDILSGIFDWKKEDIYSFLMQDSHTPNFPKALKMTPEIVDVFWSPQNLLYPYKCLLAIITSAGAVELIIQVDKNWISIFEFTTSWAQAINEELRTVVSDPKLDAEILKMQLNRLIVTTITWSCIYQENNDLNFAYLVTSHRNSEIVIWKVHSLINNILSVDININVELKFKKKLISEGIRINTLLWIHLDQNNYLLIIGFFNGQIATLNLQEFEGVITSRAYLISYSEVDNIPVDLLHILQQTDNWLEIVAVKGMYLFILTLDIYGKMINIKFISSPGFSITGLSIVNSDTILISTQDGNLHEVQKSKNEQELVYKQIKIDILKNRVQYLGLANSQNKLLFTLITSPNIMYDHLIDRDPSCIWFFSLFNYSSLDLLDIMYQEKSLLKCWDCLELIKINAFKYNILPQILTRLTLNLESLSLHQLRITYWIMIISENLKKKNFAKEVLKPSKEIEQVKLYIFLYSITNYLNHIVLEENLNEKKKLSISLLRNHLEIWLAGEEEEEAETLLSQCIKKVLKNINHIDLMQEKCNFCNVIIIDPWALFCSTGHQLPRCALTCLQVTCTKFRTCDICKEIFHPCLDIEINYVKCIYCDLPTIYKNQLTDSSLQMSEKNLSKKRAMIINNKDSKDD